MKSRLHRIAISLALILSFVIFPFTNLLNADAVSRPSPDRESSNRGITFKRPPLRFEINQGQTDSEARFIARERDGIAFLTPDGATLQVTKPLAQPDSKSGFRKAAYTPDTHGFEYSFVRLKTLGANPNPRITGLERLPGVTNYLIGNDPRKWRTNVAAYAKVKYESVYQGIDLVYYGNDSGRLEYDFIVKPGADPYQIAVSIEGAESVELDSSGDLVISAATGKIRQPAPRIYQEVNGEREQIAGRYLLLEGDREIRDPRSETRNPLVAFELAEYDESRELVIDPEVVYATYLGGSSTTNIAMEGANDVTVDDEGAAYIFGTATSADFPTRFPLQGALRGDSDAFITKLDPQGQLVYSTFIGGSRFESGFAITMDETGAIYVAGQTSSFDFPTVGAFQPVNGGRQDTFLTKLNATGSQIIYSTYLGGSNTELVKDIALDAEKNLYVLGSIFEDVAPANDFPTVNPLQATYGGGFQDGFMSVISPTGANLLYSTYLGGDGDDIFQAINVDPRNGDVYLGFFKDSSDFLTNGSSITTQGATTQAAGESNKGIAKLERIKELFPLEYIIGIIIFFASGGDPATIDSFEDFEFLEDFSAFVIFYNALAELDAFDDISTQAAQSGGRLDVRIDGLDQNLNIAKTLFFGGSQDETVNALAVDDKGAAYVVGSTTSTDLPTINPIQANHAGGFSRDGFLVVFHPQTLEPVFATYLGGSGIPESLSGVTVDKQGNIYVVGTTFSEDFPTSTPGAISDQLRGRSNAFLIKISPVEIPTEPDFTLSVDTPEITVARGAKVNLTINVNRIAGFDGQVTISRPAVIPKKVKIKPAERSTTGGEVKFKVKPKPPAPVGEHELLFTGTDQSGRTREVKVKLIIQ
ncbi:MAG: SBBP repeat-containing protein [Blastocatellia bacterium]|nr:SBBP repeat-containing protein [Blastocatellia bacterium]